MPRPKRGRPATTRSAKAHPRSPSAGPVDSENREEPGGRLRQTRSAGRLSIGEQDAIRAANRSRDTALDRLANEDVTTTSGNKGSDEDSGNSVEVGRRAIATPAHHHQDTTGLDLGDSMFGDLDDSFVADGDISNETRLAEVSSISLSTFRSRSRQSSFIGRNDPPIRPSSRSGNTPGVSSSFNIGAFRRRAREPSILGASRKPLQEPLRAAQDSGTESEGEFEPEAESTPLNNRRRTRPSTEPQHQSPSELSEPSNSRKRKSDGVHHSSAKLEKVSRTEWNEHRDEASSSALSDPPSQQQRPVEETGSEQSERSSPQEADPSSLQRPFTPTNQEEITAPPASSGSEGPDIWPDIHALAKKRRRPSVTTPTRLDKFSDMSSPPSLTHSPNYVEPKAVRPRGRPASRQQASPKVTTADLTSLLPKRRYKKARDSMSPDSDEELDTTGLGHEDDELSYLDTQAARRKKAGRPPNRGTLARLTSRGGRGGNPNPKSKQTPGSARRTSRNLRSYSHRSSDKEKEGNVETAVVEENESRDEAEESRFLPLADDTFDVSTGQAGDTLSADELRQATKKFREVDKWELDYEEVTEESTSQEGR